MSSLADLFVNAGELSETSQELEKSFFDFTVSSLHCAPS